MDDKLVNCLKKLHDSKSHWEQGVVVNHNGHKVPLFTDSSKQSSTPPPEVLPDLDQPEFFPKGCSYRFDRAKFGRGSLEDIKKEMKNLCPGCNMYKQTSKETLLGINHYFYCGFYKVRAVAKDTFKPGQFTKAGVTTATTKKKGSKSAHQRMDNPNLKHARKRGGDTTDRADRRSKKTKHASQELVQNSKKRNTGGSAQSKERRCRMKIVVFEETSTGDWYFMNDLSSFEHSYHGEVDVESTQLDESHMDEEDLNYLQLMSQQGIPPQTIANIMSTVVNEKGQSGEFLASTIKSISQKAQKALDLLKGISSNMSVAEETIAQLER